MKTISILFGLEHHLSLAGIMASIVCNLHLYYIRNIALCIFAHAVTNLALGIYVLATTENGIAGDLHPVWSS